MNEKKVVCLVIPTISRLSSLFRTIKTFQSSDYPHKEVVIVIDDNRQDYMREIMRMLNRNKIRNVAGFMNGERFGWPRSMNRVFKETDHDFYFYGSDDLTFMRDTVSNAMAAMEKTFPNGDGLIGIAQNLNHYCPAAFGLIGRKFVNRFPDRQVFYPYYRHFCGDSELWHYAQSINRFAFCKQALVHHDRPMDECKKLAQTTLRKDRELWWKKKGKKHLYWGTAFLKPADLKNETPCRTY